MSAPNDTNEPQHSVKTWLNAIIIIVLMIALINLIFHSKLLASIGLIMSIIGFFAAWLGAFESMYIKYKAKNGKRKEDDERLEKEKAELREKVRELGPERLRKRLEFEEGLFVYAISNPYEHARHLLAEYIVLAIEDLECDDVDFDEIRSMPMDDLLNEIQEFIEQTRHELELAELLLCSLE